MRKTSQNYTTLQYGCRCGSGVKMDIRRQDGGAVAVDILEKYNSICLNYRFGLDNGVKKC